MQKKKISNGTLAAIIVLAIIIADQVIKIWVKTSFRLGESMPFTNWAELYFIENPGMAFGIELGGKLFLSIFRILASVALVYFLFKIRKNEAYPKSFVVCLSMVTAGAIGNVIDGMFYGLIFSESTWYSVATLFPKAAATERFFTAWWSTCSTSPCAGHMARLDAVGGWHRFRVLPSGVQSCRRGDICGYRVADTLQFKVFVVLRNREKRSRTT